MCVRLRRCHSRRRSLLLISDHGQVHLCILDVTQSAGWFLPFFIYSLWSFGSVSMNIERHALAVCELQSVFSAALPL